MPPWRVRALLVGFGQTRVHDIVVLYGMLLQMGVSPVSIRIMSDDEGNEVVRVNPPTVPNILKGLKWLKGDEENRDNLDQLLLAWSGEGTDSFEKHIRVPRTHPLGALSDADNIPQTFMSSYLGSLPHGSSLIMLLNDCPTIEHLFDWRVIAISDNALRMERHVPRSEEHERRLQHQMHLVLFSIRGGDGCDFHHANPRDKRWQWLSTFMKSVVEVMMHTRTDTVTPLEFVLEQRKNLEMHSPDCYATCCVMEPSYLHLPIWRRSEKEL